MMPMLRRPPERTLLRGRTPKEGKAKLEKSTGFVASMREVTMKSSRDAEFADNEHESAKRQSFQIDSSPKDGETREMKRDKKNPGKSDIKAARHINVTVWESSQIDFKGRLPTEGFSRQVRTDFSSPK